MDNHPDLPSVGDENTSSAADMPSVSKWSSSFFHSFDSAPPTHIAMIYPFLSLQFRKYDPRAVKMCVHNRPSPLFCRSTGIIKSQF